MTWCACLAFDLAPTFTTCSDDSQTELKHSLNRLCLILQDQWYRRAQLALDKGEEELARDALRRKKSFSDNAAMLKKQLDQHTRASGQLMTNIRSVPVIGHSITHALRLYCCVRSLLHMVAVPMAVTTQAFCHEQAMMHCSLTLLSQLDSCAERWRIRLQKQ